MRNACLFFLVFALGGFCKVSAQGIAHEIGVFAGPVAFQSDYGQRGDMKSTLGNTGFGFGIVHYINFSYDANARRFNNYSYFNDHFKVRSELSYNKTEFQHYGKWVDDSRTSVTANQLRNMRGSSAITNVGMQLEFHPISIRDFSLATGIFAPFVTLGAQYSHFKPEAYSTTGPLTILNTPEKYRGATSNKSDYTWSTVASVGTRYKLTERSDLMVDLRGQYFFSNWVDGLNPDEKRYPENKSNDWLVGLNFGYIYYIE